MRQIGGRESLLPENSGERPARSQSCPVKILKRTLAGCPSRPPVWRWVAGTARRAADREGLAGLLAPLRGRQNSQFECGGEASSLTMPTAYPGAGGPAGVA